MCLEVKSLVKIADEDIVCYKHVLAVIPFINTEIMRFYTLYQHTPVSIGKTYTLEGKLEDCFYCGSESVFTDPGKVCVSRGAFHSYSFESALILIPILYSLFADFGARRKAKKAAKAELQPVEAGYEE